jgi:hypothetical protein
MNPPRLEMHGAEILFNSLSENPDPADLRHDLLAIRLPDGSFIDVGWHPQFDPAGRYRVSLLDQDGAELMLLFEGQCVCAVVAAVEAAAAAASDAGTKVEN